MGNFRLVIPSLAGLLVVLSIPPLRRRLPGIRRCPAGLEVLLWLAFVVLCLAELASVRTNRSTELSQAVARAAIDVAGRYLDSLSGPAVHWVSVHEPGVAVVTAVTTGLGWVLVAARAASVFRRTIEPRPHLNDWWVVKPDPRAKRRIEVYPAPSAASTALVDAHAAAQYLGVSRATVYRWARGGRLRSRRAGTQLRFSSGELAALREAYPTDAAAEQSYLKPSGVPAKLC
jgi:excisionase family DNA binding protein